MNRAGGKFGGNGDLSLPTFLDRLTIFKTVGRSKNPVEVEE